MAKVTVEFKSNLEEILPLIETATQKTLLEIGTAVQESARKNSPVRTGALRDSWTVEIETEGKGGHVIIGVPLDELDGNYAKYVENGTTKQKAQHMLRNAVEETRNMFEGIAREEFENA